MLLLLTKKEVKQTEKKKKYENKKYPLKLFASLTTYLLQKVILEREIHARENVIHELGLFQGRLGFKRAIVCMEDGVEEFSNIRRMDQIRFPKGRIRETYGEILATIKREFNQSKGVGHLRR
jgi:hypothetical protein